MFSKVVLMALEQMSFYFKASFAIFLSQLLSVANKKECFFKKYYQKLK